MQIFHFSSATAALAGVGGGRLVEFCYLLAHLLLCDGDLSRTVLLFSWYLAQMFSMVSQ